MMSQDGERKVLVDNLTKKNGMRIRITTDDHHSSSHTHSFNSEGGVCRYCTPSKTLVIKKRGGGGGAAGVERRTTVIRVTNNKILLHFSIWICLWFLITLSLLLLLLLLFISHQSSSSSSSSSCFSFLQSLIPTTGNFQFSKEKMEPLLIRDGMDGNETMVERLKRDKVIRSKRVAEVMETIDRGLFVPDVYPAYIDSPMRVGYNSTISAPHMHATCLELLEEHLQPGMHVLDIGSGTGYLTACFALMVGPEGRAVGVEHIPELVSTSNKIIQNSAAEPLLNEGSLSIHVGDGRQGCPEFAPYDAIHVGAAPSKIPQRLIDQLKPGGRLVIPVGIILQDLKVVDKKLDGSVTIRSVASVQYIRLTSRDAQLKGYY